MEKQRELDQELKIILNVEYSNQNGLVRNSKTTCCTSLPVHSGSILSQQSVWFAWSFIRAHFDVILLKSSLSSSNNMDAFLACSPQYERTNSHNQWYNNVSLQLKQLFPINNITYFITMVVFCPFLFYSLHFPLEWLILMPLSICETMQSSYSKSQRNVHRTLGQWHTFELQNAVVFDSRNGKYRNTLYGPSSWSDELSIMCSIF